ncbi:MAG: DUF4127 family protein [Caldilineaceae bacterium]|nr:DUF4127 family protein [Caldilineaceae bacterium]
MSPSIAILPLDDRPPNYEFPALLARAAGYEPILPPKNWLGTPWRAGEMEQLATWLEEVAPQSDALILALDTLGYGGLVNSRRSTDPADVVLDRLSTVRHLKERHPRLTLLGYSILMRVTRGNDAEEEKAYWGSYGARLFRISYLEDRLAMLVGNPAEDEAEVARLRAEIPAEIVQDYLDGRARNHLINRAMIEWTAAGILDYLIIPQDDTVEYGWNIAEARHLRQLARQLGVADRVSVYPGADETDMLLIARFTAQQAEFRPCVWTRYSSVRAGEIITAYEDRPMEELIKAHLGPLAGVIAETPDRADILLYVNSPAEVQGNGFDQMVAQRGSPPLDLPPDLQARWDEYRRSSGLRNSLREIHSVQRNVDEFARSLAASVAEGKNVAVVDVAFVNGGDIELGEALRRHVDLAQLAAFGGWNTAGNTLGTVLAQSVIRHLQQSRGASPSALAAHVEFLFLRFVDDYLYQGLVRSQVALDVLPRLGILPKMTNLEEAAAHVEAEVNTRLISAAADFAQIHFAGQTIHAGESRLTIDDLGVSRVIFPWGRLFEIGCEMRLEIR